MKKQTQRAGDRSDHIAAVDGIAESLRKRLAGSGRNAEEANRPVKWIEERPNVWRIVYAD